MTHGEECGLLVIGETPGDASDDVADPENVFDNHWLVVVIANPIVLQKKMFCLGMACMSTIPHW